MTHCYNCGHAGTFVLLAQFALAVSGPVADRSAASDRPVGPEEGRRRRSRSETDSGREHSEDPRRPSSRDPRRSPDWPQSCDPNRSRRRRCGPNGDVGRSRHEGSQPSDSGRGDAPPDEGPSSRDDPSALDGLPTNGGLSLAVQCPVCDSTDVGVAAADLLARYGSSTTS